MDWVPYNKPSLLPYQESRHFVARILGLITVKYCGPLLLILIFASSCSADLSVVNDINGVSIFRTLRGWSMPLSASHM